jgi:hypothetical protein
MKPSSDIESPTTTLPIAASSLVGFVIETGKDGQGPYRASRVQMPAALKIAGDLFCAFVERPPRDGVTPSTKSEASVQVCNWQSRQSSLRSLAARRVATAQIVTF